MLKHMIASIPGCPGSACVFLAVAAAVSALIFGASAIGSFSAPRVYVSKLRIKLMPTADNTKGDGSEPDATSGYDALLMRTECEVMRSEVILTHVISTVGMNQTQGKRRLGTQEGTGIGGQIGQLRKRIEVRPLQKTNLMDICVLSEDPNEATQVANALAETYHAYQGNRLKDLPPSLSSPLRVQVMDRALPVRAPVQPNNLPGLARDALGSILLGVAAGSVVVLVGFRRKPPMSADVLPSVFVIVFSVVLGVSALKSSANLAVATAAGLLLAFVVGAVADWFMFLRKKYPETPNVFSAVFMTVFLLVAGVGALDAVLSTKWYSSTARLRLRLASPDRAGQGTSPGGSAVYDSQLVQNEGDFIRSEDILRPVIADLDLNRQWGKRYSYGNDDTPISTKQAIALLKKRIEVHRIPDTCLIEIRVRSDKAEEAARLANALAETYRGHRRDHPATSPQGPIAIQVEVLDHGVPAASPVGHYELEQFVSYALVGLCLAFAVGGKVMWGVSEILAAQRRKLSRP